MPSRLSHNSYGKHRVRVSKIRRPRQGAPNTERHEFVEAAVDVELEGDFDAAFTNGDNRSVVATDTCKNTVYALAKDDPLETIESFGLTVARHFIGRYEHVSRCRVRLTEHVWERLADSPHAFVARDSVEPTAEVVLTRGAEPVVTSGVEKLMIAKTTESGFVDFHRDDFRTLPDTEDRILATEMTAEWRLASADADFATVRKTVVDTMLARFVDHYSRSVQETLHLMAAAALDAAPAVAEITLTMPNKHHLLAKLVPEGTANDNEVFVVTDEPFGYISATLARE
ncbi:Uricase [Pseudobythopirellula maris]|uniref:Uricase n=1 Tax=Pseudobythopirellula maris TaxID=2527991 RepID=A0A5C5ZKG8_9BACT|nr:urate oxidase [Pseudobythopirellula maris]TWT87638.1 Uricase [Pseudobythopirellula maris]